MSLISKEENYIACRNTRGVFTKRLNQNEYLIFDYWFYEGMNIQEAAMRIEYGYEKTRRIFESMLRKMKLFCDEHDLSHEMLLPLDFQKQTDVFHTSQSNQFLNVA
jgi:hypothetical protein